MPGPEAVMNKRLSEAISRISGLSDDRQQAAATVLLDFLDSENSEGLLTPEQIVELERRLDNEVYASDEEVRAFFARLKA
jgi:hypothetical protein